MTRLSDNDNSGEVQPIEKTYSSRILLTTYPRQNGVEPIPLKWFAQTPAQRGPIIVSRSRKTLKYRNAIGAHAGGYSVYFALALASGGLKSDFTPDFTKTEPTFNFKPQPSWSEPGKIVSMDPYGHEVPTLFKSYLDRGIEIKPSISVTRATMRVPEVTDVIRSGSLPVDGSIVLNAGGDVRITKVAVEPVWNLPGVAARFNISEQALRRALFEHTGGSFPELITRPDIQTFLPPIGGHTVYIFGDPAKISDEKVRLALRVHDECNGSDVFGSDICTCRPYLMFGIAEAIREAQNGGSGVVVYYRKEGRALGEVVKYLVYNARKRYGDTADKYFERTEDIAGVRDMRFQELMPDVLHWLGIKKIDRMLSMSNMKHDAIVSQGIQIHERVPIPDEMLPEDSRVEIDAKIVAGYFSGNKVVTSEDLTKVRGRDWQSWEEIVH